MFFHGTGWKFLYAPCNSRAPRGNRKTFHHFKSQNTVLSWKLCCLLQNNYEHIIFTQRSSKVQNVAFLWNITVHLIRKYFASENLWLAHLSWPWGKRKPGLPVLLHLYVDVNSCSPRLPCLQGTISIYQGCSSCLEDEHGNMPCWSRSGVLGASCFEVSCPGCESQHHLLLSMWPLSLESRNPRAKYL